MDISRERRRDIIAALRKGTVPQRGLDFLAVGLGRFEPVIAGELADVAQGGAAFKAVRGDYGCGKTFFGRWVQEYAKRRATPPPKCKSPRRRHPCIGSKQSIGGRWS